MAGAGNISLHHRVGSGGHPAFYQMSAGSFPPGVKRPGREADRSPPSSAEVNNAWSYTSTPNTSSWRCFIKQETHLQGVLLSHMDKFTSTFNFI
jgi:hypothetical protein